MCLKYQIITTSQIQQMDRTKILQEIKSYLTYKIQKYKGRRLSQPNLMNMKDKSGPPQSSEQYNRDRRMSHPITSNEVKVAQENHIARERIQQGQQEIHTMKDNHKHNQQKQYEVDATTACQDKRKLEGKFGPAL